MDPQSGTSGRPASGGDLTEEQQCQEVIADAAESLDGLDILVLNAGYQRSRGEVDEIPTAEFDRVMRTNLYAPFWLARSSLPHLPAGGASIIVTTSIQGGYDPSPGLFDYALTKAALVAFVQMLAEQQPARHPGERCRTRPDLDAADPCDGVAEEAAHVRRGHPPAGARRTARRARRRYVYLASEDASYVSGGIIPVTGGRHL